MDDEILHIETNGGSIIYNQVGICSLVPVKMFCNSNSIANVLSLSMVANIPGAKVEMNSEIEKAIAVHFDNGKVLKFQECKD